MPRYIVQSFHKSVKIVCIVACFLDKKLKQQTFGLWEFKQLFWFGQIT